MTETAETAAEQLVTHTVDDGVAWITLNRPGKRNAVSGPLRSALAAAVRQAERDVGTRVVVLTGSGNAFCAGADVRELASREPAVEDIRGEYERILTGLRTMPKPTIAAVNGVAAGIGASLAMCCDLRYATPGAYFKEAFVNIGLTVDGGVSWLLPRIVGSGRALELFYTGDDLSAIEAERMGLVNHVVDAEELEPTVRALAARLAGGPTEALGAMKRSVNFAATATLEEAIDFEFLLQGVMMESQDFRARVQAFVERRT
jgi:2-(1,2-epoxy-1,2-dihydrophenyl)acetyl-CoA isomerase